MEAVPLFWLRPFTSLFFFFFFFFSMLVLLRVSWAQDPTDGFTELPLNSTVLELHKPFDLPPCSRYLFSNQTHRFWVLKTDNAAWKHAGNPRSEIRMRGLEYTTGIWQFEGSLNVPNVTTGVCIFQVFGPYDGHPTIMMLKVYDCMLCFYNRNIVLARDICDRWVRLNIIHNADAGIIFVFMDGALIKQFNDRKHSQHWFQFGLYAQDDYPYYMEASWKEVKLLKKNALT